MQEFFVKSLRIYCSQDQPSGKFDGFRIAIFDFSASVPGEILWPENGQPKLVIPEGDGNSGWYEFPVAWPPRDKREFLVGQEQFFDWPECDPFCFDDNDSANEKHTWLNCDGVWSRTVAPNNLMLRLVAGYYGAVAPTSLGRIKALYQ